MVVGAHRYQDHVVRVVVVEHKHQLEHVMILHLPVEEIIVLGQVLTRVNVILNAVLVRL